MRPAITAGDTVSDSLPAIIAAMKSDASLYAARGLASHAAVLNAHVPSLEAIAGGLTPFGSVPGLVSSDLTTGGVAQIVGWKPEAIARHARTGSFASAYTLADGTWRIPTASVTSFMRHPAPKRSPEPTRPVGLVPMPHRKEAFDREQFVAPFRSSSLTGRAV